MRVASKIDANFPLVDPTVKIGGEMGRCLSDHVQPQDPSSGMHLMGGRSAVLGISSPLKRPIEGFRHYCRRGYVL